MIEYFSDISKLFFRKLGIILLKKFILTGSLIVKEHLNNFFVI